MKLSLEDDTLIELRDKINQAIKEDSQVMKDLIEAKQTYNWMTKNRFLIPEKLVGDIKKLERSAEKTQRNINKAIQEYDHYVQFKKSVEKHIDQNKIYKIYSS